MTSTCRHFNLIPICLYLILIFEIPSDIQSGRMLHNQATMQELKSMFSEMKDLLHQQVIWFVSRVPQYTRHS